MPPDADQLSLNQFSYTMIVSPAASAGCERMPAIVAEFPRGPAVVEPLEYAWTYQVVAASALLTPKKSAAASAKDLPRSRGAEEPA